MNVELVAVGQNLTLHVNPREDSVPKIVPKIVVKPVNKIQNVVLETVQQLKIFIVELNKDGVLKHQKLIPVEIVG